MARQHVSATRGVRVNVGAHRPNDGEPVSHGGCMRQGFAKVQTWHAGGNRAEAAADFGRGFGFGIECFVLGRTAAEKEYDA